MAYRSLRNCVNDLLETKQAIVIEQETDPHLVMAEIHRRVNAARGPALLFSNVKDSRFDAVSNIYGTFERTEYLFRSTMDRVRSLVRAKSNPVAVLKRPARGLSIARTAFSGLPTKKHYRHSHFQQCAIDELPQIVGWPDDGGAFITLPQVLTLPPGETDIMKSNVGMYRVQLSGNAYLANEEVGMHYQLHRGIGVHHQLYNQSDQPFHASIFVGGPPAHTLAAIMPLPEGLSELTFAGLLAGRRFRYAFHDNHVLALDADFCITGTIIKDLQKPEGPFGDHLGYYSLQHDFPVFKVNKVYHRKNPIWQFTVVGRPPQEDSSFGHMIHQLVAPALASEFPGIRSLNAVDAAGVHPLLLAVGSERYMPFREKTPEEILTLANHLLGQGQTSLAKFLIIADGSDNPELSAQHIEPFMRYVLERIDLTRDLHFQTKTTIDTLDYSGSGWNSGSKLVIAACGDPIRTLSTRIHNELAGSLGQFKIQLVLPGVLAIAYRPYLDPDRAQTDLEEFRRKLEDIPRNQFAGWPLIVLCDDPDFLAAHINNFLWTTFTRSNPATDVHGLRERVINKHWECDTSLIIDARAKPHHAPTLTVDKATTHSANEIIAANPSLMKLGI